MAARLMLVVLLACYAALAAHAHTKLASSVPAAGAVLERPATDIVLEFAEPVRLTAVTLTDAENGTHALDALPQTPATRFTIGVRATLPAGEYVVAWRAVGADTHLVSGEIPFRIAASAHSH